MMKNILFINFGILISLSTFGQKEEIKCPSGSILKKIKNKNEVIWMCVDNDTLHGPTLIYSNKGKLTAENYWIRGIKSGTWKTYTKDGILLSEEKFDTSDRSSIKTFYYKDGKPQTLTTFLNNKKNGRIAEWFANGIQNTEGYFINDIQDGIWMFRMPDLKTITVVTFKNGKEVSTKDVIWTGNDLPLELANK